MRKAINDNPMAQIAVVGVLLVGVALFLMGGMGGKKTDSAATEASAVPPAPGAVPGQDPPAGTPATAATSGAPTTSVVPAGATAEVDAPPLPRPVQAAYRDGQTVVLLVTRGGGIDDRLVSKSVGRLRSIPGITVFTTRAKGVARYTAITEAVNLDRVPALIVVTPSDLSSGDTATAEVRYGFLSADSVVQQVRDILYRGPTVGYAPD